MSATKATKARKKIITHHGVIVEITLLLNYKSERSVPHWISWHLLTFKCEQYPNSDKLNFQTFIEDNNDFYKQLVNYESYIIKFIDEINALDDVDEVLSQMGWK